MHKDTKDNAPLKAQYVL